MALTDSCEAGAAIARVGARGGTFRVRGRLGVCGVHVGGREQYTGRVLLSRTISLCLTHDTFIAHIEQKPIQVIVVR